MSKTTHSNARLRLRALSPIATLAFVTLTSSALTVVSFGRAEAKTPGARYCFTHACHRVMTLEQTQAQVGKRTAAVTSFYDDCRRDRYNPCGLTSSGEAYRPGEANSAASPIYPDGTVILVRNPRNGETAIVRINNAGPYWGNRTLDLSRAAGMKLGLANVGVAKVELIVLRAPTKGEATYRKGRVYSRLPGHVGAFASLGEAQIFAALKLELPDAISDDMIAVAYADPQVTPAAPLSFEPVREAPPKRRLPADVIRLAELQPSAAVATPLGQKVAQAPSTTFAPPSLVAGATEISGASLIVPHAGGMSRDISERASIIGALRAGDFDRRGRSLLEAVEPRPAYQDPIATDGLTRLAGASSEEEESAGAELAKLERMSPLATRGERGWQRRATASVSNVVPFAPASVATPETHIARWAALLVASHGASSDEADSAGRHDGFDLAMNAPVGDRVRDITRTPARARSRV